MDKVIVFTDLNAWKEAHKLALMIYQITKNFPAEERFCLVPQLRRAVVSITSNIAEGFCRRGKNDKINFYNIAISSLTETQNQIILSRDLGYINENEFSKIWNQTIIVQKLVFGIIKGAVSYNQSQNS